VSTPTASLYCPACSSSVQEWLPGPNGRPHARCPGCQALERHRLLALVFSQLALVIGSSRAILDVAPQAQLRRLLTERVGRRYVGLDMAMQRHADVLADLSRLPFGRDTFDLILCYHVLEHVPDDKAAMRELARVLQPGAFALVQVPYKSGQPTDEDPSAPVEERRRRFGQDDHVRYYGFDFEDRLLEHGLQPWRFRAGDLLEASDMDRMGIIPSEMVWLCRTSAGAAASDEWTVNLRWRGPPVGPSVPLPMQFSAPTVQITAPVVQITAPTVKVASPAVTSAPPPVQPPRRRVRRVRRRVGRSALGPPLRRVREFVRNVTLSKP